MKYVFSLLLFIFLFACKQAATPVVKKQPAVIAKNCEFDIEKITFKEDALALLKNEMDSSFYTDNSMVDNKQAVAFEYPLDNRIFPWNGSKSLIGYAYYSNTLDSVAVMNQWRFSRLGFLSNTNKNVMAVLAKGEFLSDTVFTAIIKYLTIKYGEPAFKSDIASDNFYEWQLPGRIMQIEFFEGGEISVNSNPEKNYNRAVYNIKLLVFEKKQADELFKMQKENAIKKKKFLTIDGGFKIFSHDPAHNQKLLYEMMEIWGMN
jgi:hypothetical protein